MLASSKRRVVALVAALAAIGAVVLGTQAVATHTPADKVVAAGDRTTQIEQGTNQTILSARIKTAKPTDLMIHVSAECAVETSHTRDGKTATNTADASARVWIEVDGRIVPIETVSEPPQDPAAQPSGTEKDKVTFCHRNESYQRTDNNPLCQGEQPNIPPDPTMVDGCEFERWFQNVKTANAFNWVRLNVGNGEHTVVVKADVREAATASTPDTSTANAYIGNRTLIVEPTKMSNDTLVLPAGSG